MLRALDDLLDEQNDALAEDLGWLGSEAHRRWLEDVAHGLPNLADITVVWVAPGKPGYWEASTRTIAAERPVAIPGLTPECIARMALLGLIHETLHAELSTATPVFRRQLRRVKPELLTPIGMLFNFLEDGRITRLGKAANPDIVAAMDDFISGSVDQMRKLRPASAETLTPARPSDQLFFALSAYALSAEVPSPLRPDVDATLKGMLPAIDQTRAGKTDDCGLAAIELVQLAARFRPTI